MPEVWSYMISEIGNLYPVCVSNTLCLLLILHNLLFLLVLKFSFPFSQQLMIAFPFQSEFPVMLCYRLNTNLAGGHVISRSVPRIIAQAK